VTILAALARKGNQVLIPERPRSGFLLYPRKAPAAIAG